MKITLTTLLHTSLIIITLATLSSCGLKGPLVLEEVPVEKTQAPLNNSTDQIPVETPIETTEDNTGETKGDSSSE